MLKLKHLEVEYAASLHHRISSRDSDGLYDNVKAIYICIHASCGFNNRRCLVIINVIKRERERERETDGWKEKKIKREFEFEAGLGLCRGNYN